MTGVQIVVRIGGGLLAEDGRLDRVLAEIHASAHGARLLIVPGGGPFADAVREVDRRLTLTDEAAHWMAVLAMDQYAVLIASRLPDARLVSTVDEIGTAIDSGHVPVLAPHRWLREADPLPHSWEVTSDSIAAWIAGTVGARHLVLVKPAGATGELVDAYFSSVLPRHVSASAVPADDAIALRRALVRCLDSPAVVP